MIEKIMKAVKSGNKKRGRNITIGAVVGMLLSCTVVMGADVVGLDIKKEDSGIEFSKDGTGFTPGKKEAPNNDPYLDNSWEENTKTYTNNSLISGTSTNTAGYGIKIDGQSKTTELTLVNKALILGKTSFSSKDGYGIYISDLGSSSNFVLTNDGLISGISSSNYGIGLQSLSTIAKLTNNGLISGIQTNGNTGMGIYNNSTITDLTNNGLILGSGPYSGTGILNLDGKSIENVINKGLISALGSGSRDNTKGINNGGVITKVDNAGVIYGDGYAISNGSGSGKDITNGVNNYGLLGSGYSTKSVTNGLTIVDSSDTGGKNKIKNYGLAFTADSSANKYIGGGKSSSSETNPSIDYHNNFGKIHQNISIDGVSYDIINADAEVDPTSKEIKNWKSLSLEEGKLTYYDSSETSDKEESISPDKKYILNGIEDTLKVSGENNELNNSLVNAYKSAVVMDKGASTLTLDNTVVNGGIADGSTTVNITGEGNNFTAKGNSIINTGDEGTAITVDGDKNTVTLEGNTIVNGKMSATGEKNTLNLYGKQNMKRSSDNKSMNIFHDIEGFGRIQIENNVTFFEDAKVTGVDRININNGGTLSLRLKAGENPGAKATHALSAENTGLLIAGKEEEGSENAGTLNFITNGMGKNTVIDMGGIKLENVYLRANSIVYMMEVVEKTDSDANVGDIRLDVGTSLADIYNERKITSDPYSDADTPLLPDETLYNSLNKIYQSSVADDDNVDAVTGMIGSSSDEEQWRKLLSFLGGIYTESPYSYSSELSRRSIGMFRDVVVDNIFRPETNKWLIMGGLTHADGGTKDTYYGQNYYEIDNGSSSTSADMKLTGAYMLAKYGYSENISLGVTLGGNKSEAKLDMAKVKGNSGYLGAFAENYRGNLTLKAGAGVQYSEYDADRSTLGGHSYSDKYSDMAYDIYLNGRYSHQVGANLFLEPYATLSYTYVDQDGANEGSKVLAIETDSKSFDYTVGKVGVDLKKVIPHEKGKSTLSAGVSYTKIFDGADEEYITGRFKGGSDFDILVAHKNEHSIGLNAKYALELESGVIFDVKGTYSVERDSHNGSGKNKTKGEWIVGAGVGYKF